MLGGAVLESCGLRGADAVKSSPYDLWIVAGVGAGF